MASRTHWFPALFRGGAVCVVAILFWQYYTATYGRTSSNDFAEILFEAPALAEVPQRNRIAFTDNDGLVWITSSEGEDRHLLSANLSKNRLPTWSPDGKRLAYLTEVASDLVAVHITPAGVSSPTVLAMSPGSVPIYLSWSPDSKRVAYLAQEGRGLTMRVVEVERPSENVKLDEGTLVYWSWSNDGAALLVHAQDHLYRYETIEKTKRTVQAKPSRLYQTPLWSRDGASLFFAGRGENGENAVYIADAETLVSKSVTPITEFCRMTLSPGNGMLACVMAEENVPTRFGRAAFVDVESGERRDLADFLVSAIYWSRDGKKAALLVPFQGMDMPDDWVGFDGASPKTMQQAEVRGLFYSAWWLYDLELEQLTPLVSFLPSREFSATVPYFDQHHDSHSFWSPDSRYLLTCAREPAARAGSIWILDTWGETPPRFLAEGTFAVWSWG